MKVYKATETHIDERNVTLKAKIRASFNVDGIEQYLTDVFRELNVESKNAKRFIQKMLHLHSFNSTKMQGSIIHCRNSSLTEEDDDADPKNYIRS